MPKAVYLERQQLWRGPGEDGVMAGISHDVVLSYSHKAGVYVIRNTVDGKVYVGSAALCLVRRAAQHRNQLRRGKHINKHMQAAWGKHGGDSFICEVVEITTADKAVEREQFWIDYYKSYLPANGYNRAPKAGSNLGVQHTPETRKKFSEALRKRLENPEERRKVGAAMRGKKHTEETKQVMTARLVERWANPEFKEKVSKILSDVPRTDEWKQNISKAHKGKKKSPTHAAAIKAASQNRGPQSAETIAKRVAKLRGRKMPPEAIAKTRAANLGKKKSPEARAKMAAAQKLRFQDPEQRRLMSLAKLEAANAKKRKLDTMGRTGGEGA